MTRRQGNLLGFAACLSLLAYAYYAELVLHLAPCPLCIFQRVGVFAIGVVFLIAAAHDLASLRGLRDRDFDAFFRHPANEFQMRVIAKKLDGFSAALSKR